MSFLPGRKTRRDVNLIAGPIEPMIVHHSRGTGNDIITRVVTEGTIALDPPGLEIALSEIYSA